MAPYCETKASGFSLFLFAPLPYYYFFSGLAFVAFDDPLPLEKKEMHTSSSYLT